MSRFVKVGEAAKILGVGIQTLRRGEEVGYLLPDRKSKGKTSIMLLMPYKEKFQPKISLL